MCITTKKKKIKKKSIPKKECLQRHSRNSLAGVGITGGMPVIGSS